VDPEAEGDGEVARQLRVLLRMRFLRDWISFISPRSQLSSALQSRVAALEALPEPLLLDGVPLRRSNGDLFSFEPQFFGVRSHSWFFSTRSKITDSPDGGVVLPLPSGDLFFIGIRQSQVELAASQALSRMTDTRTEHGEIPKVVACMATEHAFSRLRLPRNVRDRAQAYGNYIEFELRGNVFYSDAGTLFGVLPTDEVSQET
jgi:hypothetical protein